MPTSDQNMLDAVRTFVEGANKGRVEESIWNLIAEPETFVFAEAFGEHSHSTVCQHARREFTSG